MELFNEFGTHKLKPYLLHDSVHLLLAITCLSWAQGAQLSRAFQGPGPHQAINELPKVLDALLRFIMFHHKGIGRPSNTSLTAFRPHEDIFQRPCNVVSHVKAWAAQMPQMGSALQDVCGMQGGGHSRPGPGEKLIPGSDGLPSGFAWTHLGGTFEKQLLIDHNFGVVCWAPFLG